MNLAEIRKNKGLTLKQVAFRANVSEALICLVEQGKRGPSVKAAKRIAPIYGIDWTEFYSDERLKKEA